MAELVRRTGTRTIVDTPHLIGKAASSDPTRLQSSSRRDSRPLPDDLLREASRRLGIMALLGAALWILGTLLDHVAVRMMSPNDPRAMDPPAIDAIAVSSAVLSLALFFYTRRSRRNPRFILDLGLVYMVLTALGLGLIIYILRQVCESLEEAHVRGLVHRDIKPANIHVGRLGLQHDFVKVLDFGLVKSIGIASAQNSLETDAGLTPGTPAYMAPEMALGQIVDGRADIYAVGCVAYYLLTGGLVFEAENLFQMMAMRLRDDPVAPSRRTTVPIPAALDRLVLDCLARKPEERPRTAAELGRALASIDCERWDEAQARQWWTAHGRPEPLHSLAEQVSSLDAGTIILAKGVAG
jgi:hypothetical protein